MKAVMGKTQLDPAGVILDTHYHRFESPSGFVRFQEVNQDRHRFLLSNSIPKSVLDGEEQGEYVVATYQPHVDSPESGSVH